MVNDSSSLYGSTFTSSNQGQSVVLGRIQATFPDPAHGVLTGAGTTLKLRNLTGNDVVLSNTNSLVNNATINIVRIS